MGKQLFCPFLASLSAFKILYLDHLCTNQTSACPVWDKFRVVKLTFTLIHNNASVCVIVRFHTEVILQKFLSVTRIIFDMKIFCDFLSFLKYFCLHE